MKYLFLVLMWGCAFTARTQVREYRAADSLYASFHYSAAATLYAQLSGSPDSVMAFRRLAQCYHKLGDYLAEGHALSRIPADSLTHDDMRQLYFSCSNTGDSVAMESWGRKVLRLYPYDADITASVAADLMAKNEVDSAKQLALRYLEKDTLNCNVLRQYAYSCYLLGDYGEALNSYLKLDHNGWKSFEVNFITGVCYGELGDANHAYDYLVKANQMKKGKDLVVLKLLAQNCLKIGMPMEAASYLERAINLVLPDSVTMFGMYRQLAESYFSVHDYERAALSFQQASRYDPTNAITYYNIAQMYNGMKDAANMLKYYKLFIKYASNLQDNEENRELIGRVKELIAKEKE